MATGGIKYLDADHSGYLNNEVRFIDGAKS